MDRKPVVKKEVRGRNVYFTVNWSRLKKGDKYEIVRSVPSDAGIFELYYMDRTLMLFGDAKSFVGDIVKSLSEAARASMSTLMVLYTAASICEATNLCQMRLYRRY